MPSQAKRCSCSTKRPLFYPANEANPILQKLRELAGDGLAVLVVTHRLREVTDYCDTLTVLRDGMWC